MVDSGKAHYGLMPSAQSPHGKAAHSKGMSVSELCTLAPWDELAAFRREVQIKFDEVFTALQERREGESRLTSGSQQLEAKVERFARQTRGLHSRSEVFEGHLTAQAKELDSCKEAQEALRERFQRTMQEFSGNLASTASSLRSELDLAVEQRHELALEASRRGDRAIADELAKQGLNVWVPKVLAPFEGGTDGDGLPPDFDIAKRGSELGPLISSSAVSDSARMKRTSKLAEIQETKKNVPRCGELYTVSCPLGGNTSVARMELTSKLAIAADDRKRLGQQNNSWSSMVPRHSLCKRLNVQWGRVSQVQSKGWTKEFPSRSTNRAEQRQRCQAHARKGFVVALAPKRCLLDYHQNEHGSLAAAPVQVGRKADKPEGHQKT